MPYHGEKQTTMSTHGKAKPSMKKVPKLPHPMFKDGKMVMAKTVADHKRLEKLGYTHSK